MSHMSHYQYMLKFFAVGNKMKKVKESLGKVRKESKAKQSQKIGMFYVLGMEAPSEQIWSKFSTRRDVLDIVIFAAFVKGL